MYNIFLESFIRAAETKSFSKAAEQGNITPSAVIKQIRSLEAELGCSLFVRTHHGVELTPAGQSLYNDAKIMITFSNTAVRKARLAQKNDTFTINIGVSIFTPADPLLEYIGSPAKFMNRFSIELVPNDGSMMSAYLVLRNLGVTTDIVLDFYDELLLETYKCNAFYLGEKKITCLVPINHPLANRELLKPEDLSDELFYYFSSGGNRKLQRAVSRISDTIPRVQMYDINLLDVNYLNSCVKDNALGLGLESWQGLHPMLKNIPVDWDYTVQYGILYSKTPSVNVAALLNYLKQTIIHQ